MEEIFAKFEEFIKKIFDIIAGIMAIFEKKDDETEPEA